MSLWSGPRARVAALTAAGPDMGVSTPPSGSIAARATGQQQPGMSAQPWQFDIWQRYDQSGILKSSGMYRGNMYRRVRLRIGVRPLDDPDGIPLLASDVLDPEKAEIAAVHVPTDLIVQAQIELARITGPLGKQGILYDFGVNLSMVGDCRLAVIPDPFEPNGERWQVFSVIGIRQSGVFPDKTPRWTELGPPSSELPHGTMVWRIYVPHPARFRLSDAAPLGIIEDLEELRLIGRAFRALARHHIIAGAGLLAFPNEIGLGRKDDSTNPDSPSKIAADLMRNAAAAYADEEDAAGAVPMLIEGPGESMTEAKGLRHIPFNRPNDPTLQHREDAGIKRVAIGMDTPPERITGIGQTNHWTGAQVSEEAWRDHGEPGMLVITSQLMSGPIRALLAGAVAVDPATSLPLLDPATRQPQKRWTPQQIAQIVVTHDASSVIDHPDQAQDAKDLWDRFVISNDALIRSTGFSDTDKPDPAEAAARVEQQRLIHSRGSEPGVIPAGDIIAPSESSTGKVPTPPSNQQQATPATPPTAGPAVPAPRAVAAALETVTAASAASRSSRPVGARLADTDQQLAARVHGAAQAAVRRTLERTGVQIMSKAQRQKAAAVGEAARTVPKHRVAAAVGKTVVASLGVDDQITPDDFADLLDDVDAQTARARRAGLAALLAYAAAHGLAVTDAALTEYQAQAARSAETGRQTLAQALAAWATAQLYAATGADGGIVGPGEGIVDGEVPYGLIRSALAEYGGQDVSDLNGDPLRGVAGGPDNMTIASGLGIQTDAWQWVHGDPLRPFIPHEQLDGQIFSDGSDSGDRSNTADAWLGSTQYFPGDHDGCTCWVIPLLSVGDETTPS